MNLEMKTKKELIEMLENQTHLAEAVDAKDAEIAKLNSKLTELKKENTASLATTTAELKNKYEKELTELRGQVKDLQEYEQLKNRFKQLLEDYKKLQTFSTRYVTMFQNYLKAEQANLDNIIELQSYILETSKK